MCLLQPSCVSKPVRAALAVGVEELVCCTQGDAGGGCRKAVSFGQSCFQRLNLHRYV